MTWQNEENVSKKHSQIFILGNALYIPIWRLSISVFLFPVINILWALCRESSSMFFGPPSDSDTFIYLHIPNFQFRGWDILQLHNRQGGGSRGRERKPPLGRRVSAIFWAHLGCHVPSWNISRYVVACILDPIKLFICLFLPRATGKIRYVKTQQV